VRTIALRAWFAGVYSAESSPLDKMESGAYRCAMTLNEPLAKTHLAELNVAVRATTLAPLPKLPAWFFPGLALCGPALVGVRWAAQGGERTATDATIELVRWGSLLVVVAILGTVLVAAWRAHRSAAIRPKAPIRGGRTSAWMLLVYFGINFGVVQVLLWPNIRENGLVAAIWIYLWLAVVPSTGWYRHVAAMVRR